MSNSKNMTESKSDQGATCSNSLSDSPYIGGNKMSSNLKERLKRCRMHSSPLSRPSSTTSHASVAEGFIETPSSVNEFSKEKIKKSKNVPEPKENYDTSVNECALSSSSNDSFVCTENIDESVKDVIRKMFKKVEADMKKVKKKKLPKNIKKAEISKNLMNTSDIETVIISSDSENESDNKRDIFGQKIKKFNPYTKEVIENCNDHPLLFAIYNGLKNELEENEEKERKLKLIQKCHNKNSPEELTSLNRKWLTCTQLALRKLHALCPQPEAISFQDFLILLQIDFDSVKYNAETDTFA